MSSIENPAIKADAAQTGTTQSGTTQYETPEVENQNHTYRTHRVPWFIHLLWVGFWCLAVWYVLTYQFPVILSEIKSPP